jgi:hippurate hydrolase
MTTHHLLQEIGPLLPEMIEIRHRIHQEPELGYEEHQTSALVAEQLARWGWEVHRGLGGTGVVGRLRCGSGSRSIGLRADMDALPLQEKTGLAWASRRIGRMHACGHDGHTATLLTAARHLAATQRFDGTVIVIFQPAEEGGAGAKRMIDDGLFQRFPVDAVFGLHNRPGMDVGKLSFRAGPAMASADRATVTLTGTGGHGAYPHRTADPIVAAAGIVTALQSVVARNVNPLDTAVVTVGAISGGETFNVIPDSAQLKLTIRSLNPEVRVLLKRRIIGLIEAQALSYGVVAEIDYDDGYPVLVNSAPETAFAARLAQEMIGDDNVLIDPPPVTGSEDFAFMLQERPGCYFNLGNGAGEGTCYLHNPGYDFNDRALGLGAAFWCLLAERFLAEGVRG